MADKQFNYKIRMSADGGLEVIKTFENLGKTSDRSMGRIDQGTRKANRALKGTKISIEQAAKELNKLNRESQQSQSGFQQLKNRFNELKESSNSVGTTLRGLQGVGGFLGTAGQVVGVLADQVAPLIMLADQYQNLQQRIRTATKATGDYVSVSHRLLEVANDTGATLEQSVSVFQSIGRVAPALGITNKEVLQLVDTIQKLGVIGGATPEGMKYGLLQLGQGMAAGVLRAEEFNSIVENLPEVAVRIADGFSTNVGELRQMVLEGRIFSKDVAEVLLKQIQGVNEEFGKITPTISRASQALKNSFMVWLGQLDDSTGTTGTIAGVIQDMADRFKELSDKELNDVRQWKSELYDLERQRTSVERGGLFQKLLYGGSGNRQEALANLDKAIVDAQTKLQAAEEKLKEREDLKSGAKEAGKVGLITQTEMEIAKLEQRLKLLDYSGRELVIKKAEGDALKMGAQPDSDEFNNYVEIIGKIHDKQEALKSEAEKQRELKQEIDRKKRATKRAIEQDKEAIISLQDQIVLIGLSARERAQETAAKKLSAEATDQQIQKMKELAGNAYDEKLRQRAKESIDALKEEINLLGMDERARRQAIATRGLSVSAIQSEQQELERLTDALYDAQQAQQNQQAITAMQSDFATLGLPDRDLFIKRWLDRLNDDATDDQISTVDQSAADQYDKIQRLKEQAEAQRRATQAGKSAARETKKRLEQDRDVIKNLKDEISLLGLSERARYIEVATRRLSAEATNAQRLQVEQLAGQMFDEKEALEKLDEAQKKQLDRLKQWEDIGTRAAQSIEDAIFKMAESGKADTKDMVNGMLTEMARLAFRQQITEPLSGAFGNLLSIGMKSFLPGLFGGGNSAVDVSGYQFSIPTAPTNLIEPQFLAAGMAPRAAPISSAPVAVEALAPTPSVAGMAPRAAPMSSAPVAMTAPVPAVPAPPAPQFMRSNDHAFQGGSAKPVVINQTFNVTVEGDDKVTVEEMVAFVGQETQKSAQIGASVGARQGYDMVLRDFNQNGLIRGQLR